MPTLTRIDAPAAPRRRPWIARSLRRRRRSPWRDRRTPSRVPTATVAAIGREPIARGGSGERRRNGGAHPIGGSPSRDGGLPGRGRGVLPLGRKRDVPGLLDRDLETLVRQVEVDEGLHGLVLRGHLRVRVDEERAGERIGAVRDRLRGGRDAAV